MPSNILEINNRKDFRKWLSENGKTERECYVRLKRGKPKKDGEFYYLDAVEEALCFGWIDSTLAKIDGESLQRFTHRTKNSSWTELNKERVRRLEKLGLMTDEGRAVLPEMSFEFPDDIVKEIKDAGVWEIFVSFPDLYQRIRIYNLKFTKEKRKNEYEKSFEHFVEKTKCGEMYGQWNDYEKLIDY